MTPTNTDKLAEALRLAIEYADDEDWSRVKGCINLAIAAHDAEQAAQAVPAGFVPWHYASLALNYLAGCGDFAPDSLKKAHEMLGPQAAQAPEAAPAPLFVQPVSGDKLWLWQDGHKLLAYRHEYPCYSPGGDPCVLGEPVAEAEYRESYDRSSAP